MIKNNLKTTDLDIENLLLKNWRMWSSLKCSLLHLVFYPKYFFKIRIMSTFEVWYNKKNYWKRFTTLDTLWFKKKCMHSYSQKLERRWFPVHHYDSLHVTHMFIFVDWTICLYLKVLLETDKTLVHDADRFCRTPLHLAIDTTNVDITKTLLLFGADVNIR